MLNLTNQINLLIKNGINRLAILNNQTARMQLVALEVQDRCSFIALIFQSRYINDFRFLGARNNPTETL